MKLGYSAGFVLLGFIVVQIHVAECINCLNCKNVVDLSQCKDVKHCNESEVCFIEKVLSPENDFQAVYNTGCKSMKFCTLSHCNKQAYGDGNSRKKRQSGETLTLCSECCYEDSCNIDGCGYVRHPNNVSRCYSCKEVYDGGPPCTTTEDCDLNLYACSVTLTKDTKHANAYDLGCIYKRKQCQILLNFTSNQQDGNVNCCDKPLCNINPYHKKVNKTAIAMNFTCPTGIARPTTTPAPTTKPPLPSMTPAGTTTATTTGPPTTKPPLPPKTSASEPSSTVSTPPQPTKIPITHTNATTATKPSTMNPTSTVTAAPATTKLPTVQVTTQTTTATTTKAAASTTAPPKTLPPVTRTCAVCSGPLFLCEKLFAPTPCPAPTNYCLNTIKNHKDGTRSVERACGNFETCYREWYQGSSDSDKCRKFTGEEQRLDFQCTFCCVSDNCNAPLHPADNTLYKPV